ncbi:MAG: hypothetical protein JWQ74_3575 [Marmoricola sp.]|nr:hypothetical protein [Marmoricola sp.]
MDAQGYRGTGVWIRIQHRFGPRMTEWMLAAIAAGWGVIMLLPARTFDQPSYRGFRVIFGSEGGIGAVMLLVGLACIGGLIVNGARKKVTPWIRVSSAGIRWMIWIGMFFAHAIGGIIGAWAIFYPVFAAVELVNIYRAAHDVGESNAIS